MQVQKNSKKEYINKIWHNQKLIPKGYPNITSILVFKCQKIDLVQCIDDP